MTLVILHGLCDGVLGHGREVACSACMGEYKAGKLLRLLTMLLQS